ncbi:MAG: hypothetical protein AAGF36_12855 [Pseudomonadota bacterium]
MRPRALWASGKLHEAKGRIGDAAYAVFYVPMFRSALILLLCVGLLLPKATATLAILLPGSFSTIVICTGSEVITISLDQHGEPVDQAEIHGLECLSETPHLRDAHLAPTWQLFNLDYAFGFTSQEAVTFSPAPEDEPSLGRAPPAFSRPILTTSLA